MTSGHCLPTRPAGYRVTRSASGALFPSPTNVSSNRPSAESRESASFPRVASPLRSSFVSPPCSSFRSRRPAGGSVPRRGITDGVFQRGPSQSPARSVLRFSQPLDGLLRPRFLRACCIPQPRPGISPFRGFSRSTAGTGSSPARAPMPSPSERSPANRLPPSDASASRPCSVERCVPRGWGLVLPRGRSPLRFRLLQVLATRRGPGSPGPPLVAFPRSSSSPA